MNNHARKKFEVLSFWELLQRYRVQIPIIQRDYAQGRKGKEKLRSLFLDALWCAVTTEANPQDLDFIYGEVSEEVFRPLDGQQRLTTLFLLYCYAAQRADDARIQTAKVVLEKFSYETRVSSREFCAALVGCLCSGEENRLRAEVIRDSVWFFAAWGRDPTIVGMLTMLEAIHAKFSAVEDLWGRLTREPAPIQFNFIPLNDFGLSDELYIKMNARGRPLTDFENFKARFEKRINDENWDNNPILADQFRFKADGVWTDFFWNMSAQRKSDFDKLYLSFINHCLICSKATQNTSFNDKKNLLESLVQDVGNMSPEHFEQSDYARLYDSLEVYSHTNHSFHNADLSDIPWWSLSTVNSDLLKGTLDNSAPQYKKRLLVFAQTCFLLNPADMAYADWMRVVRNILQNSFIENLESFVGAIELIQEIAGGSQDIYEYIRSNHITSKFAQQQVIEEKRKAAIIAKQPGLKKILHALEDTNLCRGKITFALYCINDDDSHIEFKEDSLIKILNTLNSSLNSGVNDEIRRALLTIGDGDYYTYWKSWVYIVSMPKYRLLEDDIDLRSLANDPSFRKYLKGLVNALLNNGSLQSILEAFTPTETTQGWKISLIKDAGLLGRSSRKYISLSDDQKTCYLLPRIKVANTEDGRKSLIRVPGLVKPTGENV